MGHDHHVEFRIRFLVRDLFGLGHAFIANPDKHVTVRKVALLELDHVDSDYDLTENLSLFDIRNQSLQLEIKHPRHQIGTISRSFSGEQVVDNFGPFRIARHC